MVEETRITGGTLHWIRWVRVKETEIKQVQVFTWWRALRCCDKVCSLAGMCFPYTPGIEMVSQQAFFLLHQWVTKPANLLVQQSVLLCGISRSNWDSCGKFFARMLIVTMLLTLSSDNSNSRGSSLKSRCEFEIKLLFNSNRKQTLFLFSFL